MTRSNLRDLLERLIATFLFSFVSTVIVVQHGQAVHWIAAVDVAGFATAIVVVTTGGMWLAKVRIVDPLLDLLVRSVLTFVQYVLGAMVAAGAVGFLTFHWNTVLVAALIATGGTALKSLSGIANKTTAGASVAVPKAA